MISRVIAFAPVVVAGEKMHAFVTLAAAAIGARFQRRVTAPAATSRRITYGRAGILGERAGA
jgi:hypothetical protein